MNIGFCLKNRNFYEDGYFEFILNTVDNVYILKVKKRRIFNDDRAIILKIKNLFVFNIQGVLLILTIFKLLYLCYCLEFFQSK